LCRPGAPNAKVHELKLKPSDQLLAAEFKFILFDATIPGAFRWEIGENHPVSRENPVFDPIGTAAFEPCVPYDGPWDVAIFGEKTPPEPPQRPAPAPAPAAAKKPGDKRVRFQLPDTSPTRSPKRGKVEAAGKGAAAASTDDAAASRRKQAAAKTRAAEENIGGTLKRAEEALAEKKLAEEIAVATREAMEEINAAEVAAKEKAERRVAPKTTGVRESKSKRRRSSASSSGSDKKAVKFLVNGDALKSNQRLLAVGGPSVLGSWKPTMKCALQPCNDGTAAHKLLLDYSDELMGSEFKFVMVDAGRRMQCRWEIGDNHKVDGETPALGHSSGFGDWTPFEGEWDDSIFETKCTTDAALGNTVHDGRLNRTADVFIPEGSRRYPSSVNGFKIDADEDASKKCEGGGVRDFVVGSKPSEPLACVQVPPKGKRTWKLLQSLFGIVGLSCALFAMKGEILTEDASEQKTHKLRFGGFRWSATQSFTFQV